MVFWLLWKLVAPAVKGAMLAGLLVVGAEQLGLPAIEVVGQILGPVLDPLISEAKKLLADYLTPW